VNGPNRGAGVTVLIVGRLCSPRTHWHPPRLAGLALLHHTGGPFRVDEAGGSARQLGSGLFEENSARAQRAVSAIRKPDFAPLPPAGEVSLERGPSELSSWPGGETVPRQGHEVRWRTRNRRDRAAG